MVRLWGVRFLSFCKIDTQSSLHNHVVTLETSLSFLLPQTRLPYVQITLFFVNILFLPIIAFPNI